METNNTNVNIDLLKYFIGDNNVKIYYADNRKDIIVEGDIVVLDNSYSVFPVKIHKLIGSIFWHGYTDGFNYGSLESLDNFPDIVTGNVIIHKNMKLKNLNGCPKEINGSLVCNNCSISDITGLKDVIIGKNLIMSYNPISNISILKTVKIGEHIDLVGTPWVNKKESVENVNVPIITEINISTANF